MKPEIRRIQRAESLFIIEPVARVYLFLLTIFRVSDYFYLYDDIVILGSRLPMTIQRLRLSSYRHEAMFLSAFQEQR